MQLLNIFLFWLFFGFLCAYLAKKRNKNPAIWFILGMFLGILAVSLLLLVSFYEKKIAAQSKPQAAPPSPPPELEAPLPDFTQWYFLDTAKTPQGPFSIEHLQQLWKAQKLTASSYIWKEGMEEWKKIRDVPSLFS